MEGITIEGEGIDEGMPVIDIVGIIILAAMIIMGIGIYVLLDRKPKSNEDDY